MEIATDPALSEKKDADAVNVETVVFIEVLVLGRQEGSLDQIGNALDRQVEPPLARVLGHQLAVGGVHAGHDRRLVFAQPVVGGKVRIERLQEDAGGHGEAEKHEGPYPEYVAEDP